MQNNWLVYKTWSRGSEPIQCVEVRVARPEYLSSVHRIHTVDGRNWSCKLYSDLHMQPKSHTRPHTDTPKEMKKKILNKIQLPAISKTISHFYQRHQKKWKVKNWQLIYPVNEYTGVLVLLPDEADFKLKLVKREGWVTSLYTEKLEPL